MSRRRLHPRLYLDPKRKQWIVRDGSNFVRTGCAEADYSGAKKWLYEYLGETHKPKPSASPLIADVLNVYASEHLPHTRAHKRALYDITNLLAWWGDKKVTDVTAQNCRAYTKTHKQSVARHDLETLRAALGYWNREYGPLAFVPKVILPPKAEPRERWLTRSEAARLLWASRHHAQHLRRFLLISLYTGSRMSAVLSLEWNWIDFTRGVMLRRASGTTETKKRTPPVKLGRKITAHLKRWKRLDGDRSRFVCHYNGRRIDRLRHVWPAALERAGLDADVIRHTTRHTSATWLAQAGVPVWEAAGFLGMSVQTLTRVYAKHHPDYQKRAVDALDRKRPTL